MTNEADGSPEPRDRRAVRRKRSPPAQAGQTAISGEGAGRGAPPADGRAPAPRARQAGPRVDHRRLGSAGGVKALPAPRAPPVSSLVPRISSPSPALPMTQGEGRVGV